MPGLFDDIAAETATTGGGLFDDIQPETQKAAVGLFDDIEPSPSISPEDARKAQETALTVLDIQTAPYRADWRNAVESDAARGMVELDKLKSEGLQVKDGAIVGWSGERVPSNPESPAYNPDGDIPESVLQRFGAASRDIGAYKGALAKTPEAIQAAEEVRQTKIQGAQPSRELSAYVNNLAENVLPAVGAAGGAKAFTTVAQKGLAKAMPIVGALLGGATAGAGQEAAISATETPEETEARRLRAEEERQRNPNAALLGRLSAGSLLFRPSVTQIQSAVAGNPAARAEIGVGLGLGGGLAGAGAAMQGRLATPGEIAEGMLEGALFNKPTGLGKYFVPPHAIPGTPENTVTTALEGAHTTEAIAKAANEGFASDFAQPIESAEVTQPTKVSAQVEQFKNESIAARRDAEKVAEASLFEGIGDFTTKSGVRFLVTPSNQPDVMVRVTRLSEDGSPIGHADLMDQEMIDSYLKNSDLVEAVFHTSRPDLSEGWKHGALLEKARVPHVFEYALKNRPASIGTHPEGGRITGERTVEYNRPLTSSELRDYEMSPIGAKPNATSKQDPARKLGPGAANIEEFGPQRTIAAYNAAVDAQRAERGLPPLMSEGRKANQDTWDATERAIEADPTLPERVTNRILDSEDAKVTDEEQTALLWRMLDLTNKRTQAAERANDPSLTPDERAAEQEKFDLLESQLQRTEEANRKTGTESGRALQARKMVARDDYTLAVMEAKARKDKGEPLTLEESQQIKKESETLMKAEEEIARVETARDETASLDAAIEAARKEDAPRYSERFVKWAESKLSEFDARADVAMQSLRQRLGRTSAGVDPTILSDVFHIAKAKIARTGYNLAKFTSDLVGEFGDVIKPYLEPAWNKAAKFFESNTGEKVPSKKTLIRRANKTAEAEGTEAGIKALAEDGVNTLDDFAPYIKKLGKELAGSGMSVEQIQTRLHEIFSPIIEGVTPRQLRDAFSDYGKSRPAPTDPTRIAQSQRRGEAQKMSALDDLMEKRAALRTGDQRVEQSDRYRQLTKQINEKKKELGIVEGDPTKRLKSAIEAMETRTRNRIKDLRFEIARGERILRNKGQQPTSPELERLRAELQRVQADHNEVFGRRELTDEQRLNAAIKSAERSEQAAIVALDNAKRGVFDRPATKGKMASAELDAIKARTNAAREEVKLLKKLANPPMSDAQIALDRAMVAKERWEQVLAGEIAPSNKVPKEALSQLEEDARLEIEAMRKLAAEMRAKPRKTDDDIKIKALEKAAAEYEKRLNEADFKGRGKKSTVDTEGVAKARALRDAAKKAFDAAKEAAKPPKPSEDEIAIQQYKTRTANKTAERLERMAKGDYETKKPRVLDLSKDPEVLAIKTEAAKVKEQFEARRRAWRLEREWAEMNWKKKTAYGIKKGWEAIRNLKLSGDMSATIQTGPAMLSHPIKGTMAIGKGLRVFAETLFKGQSDYAKRIQSQIELNPNNLNGLYKQMGVDIRMGEVRDENAASILEKLANIETNWAGVPDVVKGMMNMSGQQIAKGAGQTLKFLPKSAGRVILASNESFQAIVNTMRSVVVDSMLYRHFRDAPPSKQQGDILGNMGNASTGSGGLRGQEGLRALLFAPNYYLSRLKYLSGQPLWKAMMADDQQAGKAVLEEYIRSLGTFAVLYATAKTVLGDDEARKELGAFSPDNLLDPSVGKLQTKNGTTIDFTQGMGSWASFMSRFARGKRFDDGKVNEIDRDRELLNFIKSKLSQEIRTFTTAADQKDYFGKDMDTGQIIADMVTPITWRDLDKILKEEGMTRGSLLQMMNFLFGNVSAPRDGK